MNDKILFYLIAIIFFLSSLCETYIEIFSESLFLSSYPSHWISYRFLSIVIVNFVFFSSIKMALNKLGTRLNKLLIGIFIALGTLWAVLLKFEPFWLPFAISIFASILFPTLAIICFNLATDSFSLREFKQYSTKYHAIGTTSIIFAAYTTPYLISIFDSEFLLYISLGCLIIIEILLFFIPSRAGNVKTTTTIEKSDLLSYPLLRKLLPMAVFSSVGYYFTEYLLQSYLSQEFNRVEIANFLGFFVGVMNTLLLLTQVFLAPQVINRFGVISTFSITPTILLLGSIFVFFSSAFFPIALYALCVSVSYYAFHVLAFEASLSPLPFQIRLSAKSLESGILDNLGPGIIAIFFMAISYFTEENRMILFLGVLFTLAYCIPWYYLIIQAQELYKKALERAIRLHPFAIEELFVSNSENLNKEKIAAEFLKNPKSKLYGLGFSLLSKIPTVSDSTADLLIQGLDSQEELIQLQAVDCLENKDRHIFTKALVNKLAKSTQDTITWKIVTTLGAKHSKEALKVAQDVICESISTKQVYILPIIFSLGNLKSKASAIDTLVTAMNHTNISIQLAAIQVLSVISIGDLDSELEKMLESSELKLITAAIHSATARQSEALIPSIAKHLGNKGVSRTAIKALQSFPSEKVLPELSLLINSKQKFAAISAAIKTLAFFEGEAAEQMIIQAAKNDSQLIRSAMAYWALLSAPKIKRSPLFYQNVYNFILEDSKERDKLKIALKLESPSYLQKELRAKFHMTSLRCLYWYGCYVNPEVVIKLLPQLRGGKESAGSHRADIALELLNSLALNQQLKKIFSLWEKDLNVKNEDLKSLQLQDLYLKMLMAYKPGDTPMNDTIHKLVVLREVKLFEKLTGDILYTIAEEAQWREVARGEVIFSEGDPPDGLYIVASGTVLISAKGKTLAELKEYGFFGEAGVINDTPRLATAVALTEGTLIYIDQATCDDMINEFPEILKAITTALISYLQKNSAQ